MQNDPFTRWIVGLLGGLGLFLILPRAARFLFKTFFVGVFAEVVTVIIAGLLTEKAVDKVGEKREPSRIFIP